ncbi:MAG: hypothetical protein L6R35_000048 [Caloplaca aegaea]|nr:MAG: hypothetical protein L6R35_000048 [Caloplaca aegaea]
MIPKLMRRSSQPDSLAKDRPPREWNPATFYIVIFLLIGSNAMQMIALRNEFTTFSRRADAKIGLLKQVIERVQKGEDVDVKGLLGTGDPEQEKDWERVIQEVEEEDRLWQAKTQRQEQKRTSKDTEGSKERGGPGGAPLSTKGTAEAPNTDDERGTFSTVGTPPPEFY